MGSSCAKGIRGNPQTRINDEESVSISMMTTRRPVGSRNGAQKPTVVPFEPSDLSLEDSEQQLKPCSPGVFMFHTVNRQIYLSYKSAEREINHAPIVVSADGYNLNKKVYGDINKLIEFHRQHPLNGTVLSIQQQPKCETPSWHPPDINPQAMSKHHHQLMIGNAFDDIRKNGRLIKILVSASHMDFDHERMILLEHVFPKLRLQCLQYGYDFQAVDVTWGMKSLILDEHNLTRLTLDLLHYCRDQSVGPNFITCIGDKYGYRPLPTKIFDKEFKQMLAAIDNQEDKKFFTEWFVLDDNSVPATHVLQPISSVYRDFNSTNANARKSAETKWLKAFDRLKAILYSSLRGIADEKARPKYLLSEVDMIAQEAILRSDNPNNSCLLVRRNITDIKKYLGNDTKIIDHLDINPDSGVIDSHAQDLLSTLIDNYIPSRLHHTNIVSFDVKWKANTGIDPIKSSDHSKYIDGLSNAVTDRMSSLVTQAIKTHSSLNFNDDDLYEEVNHHISLCLAKCNEFHGCEDLLQAIERYVRSNSKQPLVVFGPTGCGKTSLISAATRECKKWLGSSGCVVVRYCGTSPESLNIRLLLRSICQQFRKIYNGDPATTPETFKELKEDLMKRLKMATTFFPQVLIIDGLDQLSDDDDAHEVTWLPKVLPDYVKVILSVRSDSPSPALRNLKTIYPGESNYLEISPMSESEAGIVFEIWMNTKARRQVANDQTDSIIRTFSKCPKPLFLKLIYERSCKWHSYSKGDVTFLASTLEELVEQHFEALEQKHGTVLVSSAFSYITASRYGITESEIEDLLSADNDVINAIYGDDIPTIARIPPIAWVRLRADVGSYLSIYAANRGRVLKWFHRFVDECAARRYLSSEYQRKIVHTALSDYFRGTWSNNAKKPCKNTSLNRLLPPQPLIYSNNAGSKPIYNFRKLAELPYHLLYAGEINKMKEETLCNYEFILTKVRATSVAHILDDINLALQSPGSVGDKELQLLHDALLLSMNALKTDPTQLASQLVARIGLNVDKKFVHLNTLLHQALKPSIPNLIPRRECLTRPGSEKPNLTNVDMTNLNMEQIRLNNSNVNVTTTARSDKTFTVWNVNTCLPVRKLYNIKVDDIVIMKNNKIAILFDRRLAIFDLDSGEILNHIKGFHYQPALLDSEHLVTLSRGKKFVKIVNVIAGDTITNLKADQQNGIDRFLVSSSGYRALCMYRTEENNIQFICWDLKKKQQLPQLDTKGYIIENSNMLLSSLSEDGEIFVIATEKSIKSTEKQSAVVFNISSGKVKCTLMYESSQARGLPIGFTCFTTTKDSILSGCKDNSLRCWTRSNGKMIHSLKGHSRPIQLIRMDKENCRAVTVANHREDNSIRLWDVKEGKPLSCFIPDEIPKCVGITNCGSWVIFSVEKSNNLGVIGLFSDQSEPNSVNEEHAIDDTLQEIDLKDCYTTPHDPFDGDDDVDEYEFDSTTLATDIPADASVSEDL